MTHIPDWAARCAKYIATHERRSSTQRLAEIIAHYAKPVEILLQEAKRQYHQSYLDEANDHAPCPKSYEDATANDKCTCGADEWNRRVEEALK